MQALSVVPSWLWVAFSAGILVLLAIDVSLFGKAQHKDPSHTKRNALIESGLWIAVALGFNFWFGMEFGTKAGVEFLTGYLVEKSLSVDNLFIILLIFNSFRIPKENQHKVLFLGILGALVLRAVFILVGAQLLHAFHWILYVFGAILVFTAIRFLRESDDEIEPEDNWSIKIMKKFVPVTHQLHGSNFFIRENGRRVATPLFMALVAIEAIDLVFAVDSIPAVFAVAEDAFIAFGSNILAILGLRALYFVLADWVQSLRYLKPGLAAVLLFIGVKMLIVEFVKIPSWVSLLVIFGILTTAALSSWYVNRLEEREAQRSAKKRD